MLRQSWDFWSKLRWKLYLPEYFYRPRQILRRIGRKSSAPGYQIARLPWGMDLRIRLPELISNSIWIKGIFDIVSAETIWRLLDEGETVLDAGANIGYLTSLMSARVGERGRVIAFEPHPVMFEELRKNLELWNSTAKPAKIEIRNAAVSSHGGIGTLVMPPSWEGNRGAAFVASQTAEPPRENAVEVRLERLDDVFPANTRIALAKFDVEGHEFEAFCGARRMLESGTVRDIIFEDVLDIDSPAKTELKRYRYSIFSLAKRFRGPRLCDVDRSQASPRDDPNFLATLDPDRAIVRMKPRGWAVLREG
jgi:FkbM family methyltransferase